LSVTFSPPAGWQEKATDILALALTDIIVWVRHTNIYGLDF
jgi:hypothetical protein